VVVGGVGGEVNTVRTELFEIKYLKNFLNFIRYYRFIFCDEQLRVIPCVYSKRDTIHHSDIVGTGALYLYNPPSYR
jgi:hypothetical protein